MPNICQTPATVDSMLSCDKDGLVGSVKCVAGGGQSDSTVSGIVDGVETLTTWNGQPHFVR